MDVRAAMLQKLKLSLLTPAHAIKLQLNPMTEQECVKSGVAINPQWAGFKIPYFDIDGAVDQSMFRYRYLQYQASTGFGALAAPPDKPRRYNQPAGTTCGVYMPPLLPKGITWKQISKDSAASLIITEGELKAACGTAHGAYTLGLGGVYNWKSRKQGYAMLPVLDKFAWDSRKVYICFDSDIIDNPMVQSAASQLSWALTQRGAKVYITNLSKNEDGSKQGMDDYIAAHGFAQFGSDIIENATFEENSAALHQLNTEVAYCTANTEMIVLETGQTMKPADFVNAAYKNRVYTVFPTLPDGTRGPAVNKFTAKEWLAWPRRAVVSKLIYEPGQSLLPPDGSYNTWPGWAVEPKHGSIAPWEDLLNSVMSTALPEHDLWLRRWLACPIRHPGTKLYTAVMMWGVKQGTGKTLLGETMKYLYGKNYRQITSKELAKSFNEWARHRQFVLGDEISVGDKRADSDIMKTMITSNEITIEAKYATSYVVRDCINYYFTSNHPDAVYLEDKDRRFFIHEVENDPLPNKFYINYVNWLQKDGAAALMHYFVNELDMGDFLPTNLAPETSSKLDMILSGKSDIANWCLRLKTDSAEVLKASGMPIPYSLWIV
jgi:hypothetical protein